MRETHGTTTKTTKARAKVGDTPRGEAKPSAAEVIQRARDAAFTDMTPAKALAHFQPVAQRVATDDLAVFTGRPLLMLANVNTALATLTPALPEVLAKLVSPNLREIFELPSMVMALEFATSRVPGVKLSDGEIDALIAEASPWRALTLTYLEVVSSPLLKLVPSARVTTIREGKGKLDTAQDCVAIPGVFGEFSTALAGKHPFSAEQLARLAEIGTTLIQQIRPSGAAREASVRSPEAVLRDQLAALVVERYDHLLVLATVAFGKARADAMLPALRSAVYVAAPAATVIAAPKNG